MKLLLPTILGVLLTTTVLPLPAATTLAEQTTQPMLRQVHGQRPLAFEANQGQVEQAVKFLARGPGYHVFLTATEAVLTLQEASASETRQRRTSHRQQAAHPGLQWPTARSPQRQTVLRITPVGANPQPEVVGEEPLPGTITYAKGGDTRQSAPAVSTYARVRYVEVYPGVDLVYYGNQGQLEYDFHVAPGADPQQITLAFEGAESMEVDQHGDLVVHTATGSLRQRKPFLYQESHGVRHEVPGGYVRLGQQHIGFQVASYDTTRRLVIDPLLLYSTYLGGHEDDVAVAVAVDTAGNLYVTGTTEALYFPTTPGAQQQVLRGDTDVFVTKFDSSGALIYSTYLGDCATDIANDIAVDATGNAYVTGKANAGICLSFPQPGAFVAKLNPAGRLTPGGYFFVFGGQYDASSTGQAIAVDTQGHAYVAGTTSESDFPTTAGVLRRSPCPGIWGDGFVAKVNTTGNDMLYSTYLCGSGGDTPHDIAVDADGYAYVVGNSASHDFPTQPLQPPPVGSLSANNGFVSKLTPSGAALLYSTYLGGSADDAARAVAVHAASRHAYVTGWTASSDFPTTPGVLQPHRPPVLCASFDCFEAFVTRFNAVGEIVYSTYLYGESGDQGNGIAVDTAGNAYVTGETTSRFFPVVKAFQPHKGGLPGASDAFVAKLNARGSTLLYSSYLGGSNSQGMPLEGDDRAHSISVDAAGNAIVVGETNAFNFPTRHAWQPHLMEGRCGYLDYLCYDAFVTKIAATGSGVRPSLPLTVRPFTVPAGGTITATWAGIPVPRSADRLRLVQLGTSSHAILVADWPTTGAASGTLQLRLPRTLQPGMYELRLLTEVGSERTDLARSSPFRITH